MSCSLRFKSKEDAYRIMWLAANAARHQGIRMEFKEGDRERHLYALEDGTLNEVNDSSGGEFGIDDAHLVFSVDGSHYGKN